MKTCIIGLGLIGGSMALSLRKSGFAHSLMGVDNNPANAQIALDRGIIDQVLPLDEAIPQSELIILAVPVDAASQLINKVLGLAAPQAVVTDVGSTKTSICKQVASHPHRKRFVAGHPIAGTENTGATAAFEGLFTGKLCILCEKQYTDVDAFQTILNLYYALGMHTIEMKAAEHDKQLAYVSHLSHITSFTLALTVLEVEPNERDIFRLAGSGFASTARLAKSAANMWLPIFLENKENLLAVLDEYTHQLRLFKEAIAHEDAQALQALMHKANNIRNILK